MKYGRVIAAGLVIWSLTLVWPEINLALLASPLPTAGLAWALTSLIGLYLLLARRGAMPRQLAANYVPPAAHVARSRSAQANSLHSRPTRPYPIIPAHSRDSRPTRPMPQL